MGQSLDYEPVQNKIFYERMRAAKGQRSLFGCVLLLPLLGGATFHQLRLCSVARAHLKQPCPRPTPPPFPTRMLAVKHTGFVLCFVLCWHYFFSVCAQPTPTPFACCRSYTGHTLAKFVITLATGVATGAAAVALSNCVGALHEWKNGSVQRLLDGGGPHALLGAALWHAGYSCLLVAGAVALVRQGLTTCGSGRGGGGLVSAVTDRLKFAIQTLECRDLLTR